MEENPFPILQFTDERQAIIEPAGHIQPLEGMPRQGVVTFFQDVIDHFVEQGLAEELTALESEMGPHPIYVHEVQGQPVALIHPGVGAPLAAAILEETIALGCRNFVACGGAGVLDRTIAVGHLLVPISAVRDEGTSYHYLPPGREVEPTPEAVAAIERVLARHQVEYLLAKTWTTDGVYRETRARTALRRSEGCLSVEMEAAALFAVARFRNVKIGQILYGGDNLDSEAWDNRGWQSRWSIREKLVELAAEACLELIDDG
jgi:uridine phosphorylase